MTNGDINYQGGGDIVLTNYYNNIVNGLYRQQQEAIRVEQEEQKRGQAIAQQAQQQLSKINASGLRPQDIPDFNKMYGAVKDSFYEVISAPDNDTRIRKQAEMQEKIAEIGLLVSQSKETSGTLSTLLEDVRKNPDSYEDSVVSYIQDLNQRSTNKLNPEDLDVTKIQRKIDTSKVPDQINGIIDNLMKSGAELTGIDSTRIAGGNVLQFTEGINKEAFVTQMLQRKADPKFRKWVQEQAPEATYEEAVAGIANLYESQGSFQRTEGRQFVRDRAPRVTTTGGSGSGQPTAEDAVFNTPQTFASGSQFTSPVFLPVKSDNVSLTNTQVIDLETGRPSDNPVTGKIDATGLMKVPIVKATGAVATEQIVNSSPASIEYRDYYIGNLEEKRGSRDVVRPVLVPRERFPKTTKQVKEDISIFDTVAGGFNEQQQTNNDPLGLGL